MSIVSDHARPRPGPSAWLAPLECLICLACTSECLICLACTSGVSNRAWLAPLACLIELGLRLWGVIEQLSV
eukprot:365213-Chlamydomonas_euryale.AAC.18